jgi:hypothetical protein
MSRRARWLMVVGTAAAVWSTSASAEFCSDLKHVAEVANGDNLVSLGVGPAYTGPAIAGHSDEFPADATQNTSFPIDGAARCGLDTLPGLGTHRYSCDFPGSVETWKSRVSDCFGNVTFKPESYGFDATAAGADIFLGDLDSGSTRLDLAKYVEDDGSEWDDQ